MGVNLVNCFVVMCLVFGLFNVCGISVCRRPVWKIIS